MMRATAVLFHKFGHIQTDQRILLCRNSSSDSALTSSVLPDAGGSHENEGSRTAAFADLYAGTSDSCADHGGWLRPAR